MLMRCCFGTGVAPKDQQRWIYAESCLAAWQIILVLLTLPNLVVYIQPYGLMIMMMRQQLNF